MREPSEERGDEIMDELTTMNDTCQKPSCTGDATDTYRDEHGNSLDLCERHYYNLVSGQGNSGSGSTKLTTVLDTAPVQRGTDLGTSGLRGTFDEGIYEPRFEG